MALEQSITTEQVVKPANKIKVESVVFRFLEGDRYAAADVAYVNDDNVVTKRERINLTEADLSGWGEDDTALVSVILSKLQG